MNFSFFKKYKGDVNVLKKLMSLLIEPIKAWHQLQYPNYSEWISARSRIALLEAHAHCACMVNDSDDNVSSKIILTSQEQVSNELKRLWFGLLMDYTVLTRWHQELWSAYEPLIICIGKQIVTMDDLKYLNESWPIILKALTYKHPSSIQSIKQIYFTKHDEIISNENDEEFNEEFNEIDERSRSCEIISHHSSNQSNNDKLKNCAQSIDLNLREVDEEVKKDDQIMNIADMAEFELTPIEFYCKLLDITSVQLGASSMKMIEKMKSENEDVMDCSLEIDSILICIETLKRLLSKDFINTGLCSESNCLEVTDMLMSIIQQVNVNLMTFNLNDKIRLYIHYCVQH